MGTRTSALLVLALLTSGAAVFLLKSMLSRHQAAPVQVATIVNKDTVSVLVASADMPSGTFLKSDTTEWQEWPQNNVQEAFIRKSSGNEVMGSVVTRAFVKGEPINNRHTLKVGEKGYLVAVLGAGMRAMSVPVNVTSGNAGFITPGDRIDLLLVRKIKLSEGTSERMHTGETVLENIRVLAVDQSSDDLTKKAKIARSLTLEVTPQQAEMISIARELGTVTYTLRGLMPDHPKKSIPIRHVSDQEQPAAPIHEVAAIEDAGVKQKDVSPEDNSELSKVDATEEDVKVLDIEPARVPDREPTHESQVSHAMGGSVRVLKGAHVEVYGR